MIFSDKNIMTLKLAIETYGEDAQLDICIEEMSELTKEICKKKRGRDNRYSLLEEIADVEIMLAQLQIMLSWTPEGRFISARGEIKQIAEEKLERLKQRLSDHISKRLEI